MAARRPFAVRRRGAMSPANDGLKSPALSRCGLMLSLGSGDPGGPCASGVARSTAPSQFLLVAETADCWRRTNLLRLTLKSFVGVMLRKLRAEQIYLQSIYLRPFRPSKIFGKYRIHPQALLKNHSFPDWNIMGSQKGL